MKRLTAMLTALACVSATLNSTLAGQSPLKGGPQLAGIPVAAATVGPSNLLPNIFVANSNTQFSGMRQVAWCSVTSCRQSKQCLG
jgi:hypothetical protein